MALSYQHGFHAGNRADVLKHAILDALLRQFSDQRVLYVETHAARGSYDLAGKQANKTGEAEAGILSMLENEFPRPMKSWGDLVARRGLNAYPGSPALATERLGDAARLILFEKHPTEHAELTKVLGEDKRVRIHKDDGYNGALKLAPRRGEQMIVFVDPSYETERDMQELADWAPRALRRWPTAMILLWLPLFKDERELDFGAYLAGLEDGTIAGARWPVDPASDTSLEGSAIVAYRVDEALGQKALAIAAACQSYWSLSECQNELSPFHQISSILARNGTCAASGHTHRTNGTRAERWPSG